MPFGETPGGESEDLSTRTRESESWTNHERERTEHRKQKALAYLVETGRAKTPEEAERYLEEVLRMKEKLLAFAREQLRENRQYAQLPLDRVGIVYTAATGRPSDFEKLTPHHVDASDPQLWHLNRIVEPRYNQLLPEERALNRGRTAYRDDLVIALSDGLVRISPVIGTQWTRELRAHLSEDDVAFLKHEYTFAIRDLEQEIRDLLAQLAESRSLEEHQDWKTLVGGHGRKRSATDIFQ